MAREFAQSFYKSTAWLKCRNAYKAKAFGLCEVCRQQGNIVHHKIEVTPDNIDDPNITLNHDNLMLMCIGCHNTHHNGGLPTVEGVGFDASGDIVAMAKTNKCFHAK